MALYKFDKFKAEKAENSPDLTIIVSKSNKILVVYVLLVMKYTKILGPTPCELRKSGS